MDKTVQQIVNEKKYPIKVGSKNVPLEYGKLNLEEVKSLKVCERYQRKISPNKLKDYGELDYNLLIPSVVSRRPESCGDYSGNYLEDGQHKAVLYVNSNPNPDEKNFTVVYLDHKEGSSLKEVLDLEAKVFKAINTQRKKLTKIDELRVDLCYDDPIAVRMHGLMDKFNIHNDDFGSNRDDRKIVQGFNHFYNTVVFDYPSGDKHPLSDLKLEAGFELFNKIYGRDNYVHGTSFRAICFLERFISEGLTNGRQETFFKWVTSDFFRSTFSQKQLIVGFTSFDSPRWIFHEVIRPAYNSYNNNNSIRGINIEKKTIQQIVDKTGEKRFYHPQEWNKSRDKDNDNQEIKSST